MKKKLFYALLFTVFLSISCNSNEKDFLDIPKIQDHKELTEENYKLIIKELYSQRFDLTEEMVISKFYEYADQETLKSLKSIQTRSVNSTQKPAEIESLLQKISDLNASRFESKEDFLLEIKDIIKKESSIKQQDKEILNIGVNTSSYIIDLYFMDKESGPKTRSLKSWWKKWGNCVTTIVVRAISKGAEFGGMGLAGGAAVGGAVGSGLAGVGAAPGTVAGAAIGWGVGSSAGAIIGGLEGALEAC